MNFERGQDIKRVLGLGKFHEINSLMNDFFTKGLYSGLNFKPDVKLLTDGSGSNLHRFLIWIDAKEGLDLGLVKKDIKGYEWHIARTIIGLSGNFKLVAFNFYRNQSKVSKKYDFHKGETGLMIEIIFNEKKGSKPSSSLQRKQTWSAS